MLGYYMYIKRLVSSGKNEIGLHTNLERQSTKNDFLLFAVSSLS